MIVNSFLNHGVTVPLKGIIKTLRKNIKTPWLSVSVVEGLRLLQEVYYI